MTQLDSTESTGITPPLLCHNCRHFKSPKISHIHSHACTPERTDTYVLPEDFHSSKNKSNYIPPVISADTFSLSYTVYDVNREIENNSRDLQFQNYNFALICCFIKFRTKNIHFCNLKSRKCQWSSTPALFSYYLYMQMCWESRNCWMHMNYSSYYAAQGFSKSLLASP